MGKLVVLVTPKLQKDYRCVAIYLRKYARSIQLNDQLWGKVFANDVKMQALHAARQADMKHAKKLAKSFDQRATRMFLNLQVAKITKRIKERK